MFRSLARISRRLEDTDEISIRGRDLDMRRVFLTWFLPGSVLTLPESPQQLTDVTMRSLLSAVPGIT